MSRIPSVIKIGSIVYKVEESVRLQHPDGRNLDGHIVYHECAIRVEQDAPNQYKAAVMLHEACHGILEHAGHRDHSEAMVAALGYGLMQLIVDNPDLIKFVQSANQPNLDLEAVSAIWKLYANGSETIK